MKIHTKIVDETLQELLTGILLFGLVCMLAGVWFVTSVLKYVLGLGIGVLLALAAAVHMYWSLSKNLRVNAGNEGAANAYSIKSSMVRYAVILVFFLVVCLTDFAYPLAVFLGIMGLKAGAYLQPYTHKFLFRRGKEDME